MTMKELTFHYRVQKRAITIRGFVAYLLSQGDDWDICCVEADIKEYQAMQYARMDAKEALRREIDYWWEFYHDESLQSIPQRQSLLTECATYLICQASEILIPIPDADKLTYDMVIRLDKANYLYKLNDVLGFMSRECNGLCDRVIFGFPAQLLTYAACTQVEKLLTPPLEYDPVFVVNTITSWLENPSAIYLDEIDFDLPNVYALYENYVAEEKDKWESANLKRYQSGEPQTRYFMPRLLQQVQAEAKEALELLTPYLSDKQLSAYTRYLDECQQYILDHTKTRKKARSESLSQYWCLNIPRYKIQTAIRKLKTAVAQPNAAKLLALWVMEMQGQGVLVENIKPYSRFVAAVNKTCSSSVKADTFSKYFRG